MSNYATQFGAGVSDGGDQTGGVVSIRFNGVEYLPNESGEVLLEQAQADWEAEAGPTFIQNKPILFSGSWNDLQDKPEIPAAQVPSDWNATEGPARILNKPIIPAAQVQSDWNATEGMGVILNKPDLSALTTAVQSGTSLGDGQAVYKQKVGTTLQFKGLVAGTNVSIVPSEDGTSLIISSTGGGGGGDSGVQSISFNGTVYAPDENGRITFVGATAAQGSKADSALQSADVAPVAISGSYNDLADKPTIPAAQVPSDWNATEGPARILNKPTIPAAAKSLVAGDNIELTETPTQITITAVIPGGPEATLELVTVAATAAGQTSFTIPGGYAVGAIQVNLNGSTLAPAHYTATNGTTVVLQSGQDIAVGDELMVVRFQPVQIADVVTQVQFNNHVGKGGTAQHSVATQALAGFMPPMPPNDDKFYAFKNGALAEFAASGGGGGFIKETYYSVPGNIAHTFAANTATYEVEVWSGGEGTGTPHSAGGNSSFGSVLVTGAKAQSTSGTGFASEPGEGSGGLLNLKGTAGGGCDAGGWASAGAPAPRGGGGGGGTTGQQPRPGSLNGGNPGGGAGAVGSGQTYGSSGGYSFDRKAVVAGSTINGVVGAGGIAGTNGGKGGDGLIIVREYSTSGPSLDTIATILTQIQAIQAVADKGRATFSVEGGVITLRRSAGISITAVRSSVGIYVFTIAGQSDAYYHLLVQAVGATGTVNLDTNIYNKTQTSFTMNCYLYNGTSTDPAYITVEVG